MNTTPNPSPARGDEIVGRARRALGSLAWKRFGTNGDVPAGAAKDHQFVADTLDQAGYGPGGGPQDRPVAAAWADPHAAVPGWPVVAGPARAGDVLAMPRGKPDHWYFAPGQQMGIATGNNTSIGVRNNNAVQESDWGFRPDDRPTIRRHQSLVAGRA